MNTENLIKEFLELSERLRNEYVENINSLIRESYDKLDALNKESLSQIDELVESEVASFREELENILNEALAGVEKRKKLIDDNSEKSKTSLREKFSQIFENVVSKLKEFLS